jgi:hypothetical protein
MSVVTAALLAIALFAAVSAPALFALYRHEVTKVAVLFYGLIMVVLTGQYLGFSVEPIQIHPGASSSPSYSDPDRCERALNAAEEGSIILERGGDRLVVAGDIWKRLPSSVQTALVACAGAQRGQEGSSTPIEVVER